MVISLLTSVRRNANREKTHCSKGHAFSPDNTYRYKNKRECRACRLEVVKRRNKKGGPGYEKTLARNKRWSERNKDRHHAMSAAWKDRNRQWVEEFKSIVGCSQCGEKHPACLDFHHNDESAKTISIAEAIQNGWNIERIADEMLKCSILCANCHRKHHWAERRANREVGN